MMHIPNMKAQITLDAGGRVLIPKKLRARLGLGPGDVFDVSEAGEQITLKPVRQTMPLEKKHGFWVYTGQAQKGGAAADKALIATDRDARAAALLAGSGEREEKTR
jgi:AbrB family looped-hinge helix DNA binding protein